MTVRAILDSKGHLIQSVAPEAKLSAAIKILAERKIGAVLAMSKGRIEGILSERDIVRVLGERGAAVLNEPVSAVMTRKVVTCTENETVASVMERMTDGKFRHVPVVEQFLSDLRTAAAEVAASPTASRPTAAMYGMLGALPDRARVKDSILDLMDGVPPGLS